jgi:hypothetical protein
VFVSNSDQVALLGDKQVPGSLGPRGADLVFETLLKTCQKKTEEITGLELYPTYSYARLYRTGNELLAHTDRPACEISLTIKLGDTENYNWPIYMNDTPVYLNPGDAVLYKGCEIQHRREKCTEPDYFLGQVFIHYVDKNGLYSDYKYDKKENREEFFTKDITRGEVL